MDLGLLNFGIGGQIADSYTQAMNEAKRQAQELQNMLAAPTKDIKVNIDTTRAKQQAEEISQSFKSIRIGEFNSSGFTSSIENMRVQLKQLTLQYELLSEAERKAEGGQKLAQNIQNLKSNINNATSNLSPAIEKANEGLSKHFSLLSYIERRAVSYLAIWQGSKLIGSLFQITGEFEKQKVALESMLQNAPAADALFSQLKSFAVQSPFNFMDLTQQAKELAAYSIPANQLFDTLKRVGDIASGTGSDMSRLVLALGEVNTQTVLNGRVLRQFTTAGVPLVDELAKHYTKLSGTVVTAGDVFEKVSKKQVSFGDVMSVIQEMTSKGGMFYQMQSKQAETLSGKLSNLKDKWDIFISDLGEEHRGALTGLVDMTATMVQHWQATLTVIKSIAVAFGLYKATMLAASIIAKQQLATDTADLAIQKAKTEMAAGSLKGSTAIAAAGIGGAATGIGLGLAAMSVLVGSIAAYNAEKQQKQDQTFGEVEQIQNETDANDKLIDRLKVLTGASKDDASAQLERQQIIDKLSQTEPELADEISKHTGNLQELTKAQKEYNSIQEMKGTFTAFIGGDTGINYKSLSVAEKAYTQANAEHISSLNKLKVAYQNISTGIEEYVKYGKDVANLQAISPEDLSNINSIINSTETLNQKMSQLQYYMNGSNDALEKANLTSSNMASQNVWQQYEGTFLRLNDAQHDYNASLHETKRFLVSLAQENNININTTAGKEALAEIIKSQQSISDMSKQTLYMSLGIRWVDGEPIPVLTGWRKDLQDWLGQNTITITAQDNMDDVFKHMQEKYKEIGISFKNEDPILIKYKVDLQLPLKQQLQQINNSPNIPFWQRGFVGQVATERSENNQSQQKIKEFSQQSGMPLFAPTDKTKKERTNVEDNYTKGLLRQKQIVDDLRQSYEKYISVMSRQDAIKTMMSQGMFKNIKTADYFPNGFDDKGYIDYLEKIKKEISSRLSIKNINTNQIKSALNEVTKSIFSAQSDEIKKQAEARMADLEDELSANKSKYNLYKSLLGITGDKSTAITLAGFDKNSFVSQIDEYKNAINEALKLWKPKTTLKFSDILDMDTSELDKNAIPEKIRSMAKELQSLTDEENSSIVESITNIVNQYGTMSEKIDTINNKAALLKEEATKLFSKPEQADELKSSLDAIDRNTQNEIDNIEQKSLELTPFYQKLFGDISQMGYNSLSKLLQQTKTVIASIQATGHLNKSGQMEYSYDTGQKDEKGNEINYSVSAQNLTSMIKQATSLEKDIQHINPFKLFSKGISEMGSSNSEANQEQNVENQIRTTAGIGGQTNNAYTSSQGLQDIASGIEAITQKATEAASTISAMFSAFGDTKTADTIDMLSGVASGVSNVASGVAEIASGNPLGVIDSLKGIAGIVTTITSFHDKKLTESINRSKLAVKQLQDQYSDLERIIKRQLGEITEAESQQLLSNYEDQLAQLQSQLKDEESQKKKDKSAIEDTKEEIATLKDKIDNYYEDLMKEEYSIDIKDWASQIADSLVSAFESGQDAAAAFDESVAKIMQSVIKNIISVKVVQPALAKLKNYLFGTNGVANDGTLSTSDLEGMMKYLSGVKDTIGQAQTIWDSISDYASENGINLSTSTSSTGITASEQSLTENTGNILAGYVNNIRLDVAVIATEYANMLTLISASSTTFAAMLTELKSINQNTLLIANNSKYMQTLSDFIINKVAIKGSGFGLNMN